MAKGYWLTIYHSVSNPAALAEYATCGSGDRGRRWPPPRAGSAN